MLGARDWHQVLVNLYRYAWIASIILYSQTCRPEIYQLHPDLLPKIPWLFGFLFIPQTLNLTLEFLSALPLYYSW